MLTRTDLQERLERALRESDFQMAAGVFSELCRARMELDRIITATHCVMSVVGGRRDLNWQHNNPDKAASHEDPEGYEWRHIKEVFPDFRERPRREVKG